MIGQFVRKHVDEVFVVLGTGPSCWAFGQLPEVRELLKKTIIVGVNRGYDAGHRVTYQVSLDQIWRSLVQKPGPRASLGSLRRIYGMWCQKWKCDDLTLEEWAYAFRDKLSIHPEVWRYLRLISPHAPFVRFTTRHNAKSTPYPSIAFGPIQGEPKWGQYSGLMCGGNSAPTAIHLAAVMGASKILLLGVDMTMPDKVAREWETGPNYYRKNVKRAFERLQRHLGTSTQIFNLNPDAVLAEFPKAQSQEHALEVLRAAVSS